MSADRTTEDDRREVEHLRERVAALEDELADRAARANDALAAAQARTYWLDRWHLDLNALMARPVPARLWKLMPAVRGAVRGARIARETLTKARLERRLGGESSEAGPGAARTAHLDVPGVLRAAGIAAGGAEQILALGPITGTSPGDVGWDESAAGVPPLPHEAGAYDVVVGGSGWSEEVTLDWLPELRRVLRPGGRLVLAVKGAVDARTLLTHAAADWEVTDFKPRSAGGQDLYVLRRR